MSYFLILFLSPAYLATRRKWGACLLNCIPYGTAVVLALSFVFLWVAPLFWMVAVGHAGWHLHNERMQQHAKLVGEAVARQIDETASS